MVIILTIIFGPFLEFFLWSTGLGSILFAISLSLMARHKISTRDLILIIIFSLIADVGLALQIGVIGAALLAGAIALFGLSFFLAQNDAILNGISLFLAILVAFGFVGYLHGSLDWGLVIRNSIFTMVWSQMFMYFSSQRIDSIKLSGRAR